MITRFLTGVVIFALLVVIVTHSYACTGYPTAIINDQDPK